MGSTCRSSAEARGRRSDPAARCGNGSWGRRGAGGALLHLAIRGESCDGCIMLYSYIVGEKCGAVRIHLQDLAREGFGL